MWKVSSSDVPLLLRLENKNNSLTANAAAHVVLNLGLTVASVVMLYSTREESPNTLIRLWISTDALLSVVAVILSVDYEVAVRNDDDYSRIVKLCGGPNSLVYVVWWTLGIYWAASGGDSNLCNAPRLNWWGTILVTMPAGSCVRSFVSVLAATFLDAFFSARSKGGFD